MRTLFTFFLTALLLSTLSACNSLTNRKVGNGERETETISPGRFSEISLMGNYRVRLIEGQEEQISITTDANLLEYIETTLSGNQLRIESQANLDSEEETEIEITYRDLDYLSTAGAAVLENTGTLFSNTLRIDMSGAGVIDLLLETNTLEVSISGAGAVDLEGSTELLEARISGAGSLGAYELYSRDCTISLSGVGGAEVHVEGTLDASISGLGGISYRGNPEQVIKDVSGLGSVSSD